MSDKLMEGDSRLGAPATSGDVDSQYKSRSGMNWYVIHARTRYEKKVRDELKRRIEEFGLSDKFGRMLVPSEDVIELKSGKKRKVERLFYPGYILIEMAMDSACWQLIKRLRHVRGFIGKEHEPTPLRDSEAVAILDRFETSKTSAPKVETIFDIGETVRVTEGPFSDFSGTVEEINYTKGRLWVAISIFGRTTSTELGFNQVVRD
ncbi:MAG: transcription termination/antitermination protein NusG [Gammaproteobacteria bacterium]